MSSVHIRKVVSADRKAIAEIYNWYILNSAATFEVEAVSDSDMAKRITQADEDNPWLVAERNGEVVGYAYATPWKARAAYRQSKETSVYVHHEKFGGGVGETLMKSLMEELVHKPIHVLIAGITLPNVASIALHEKLGFQAVGEFKDVGYKFGKYINVGYWQHIMDQK